MRTRLLFLLMCLTSIPLPKALYAGRVRNLIADEKTVTSINTAVGFSTILQFDTKPTSAVIGDQDSFKVEYVGNSLTIKPLSSRSKTNLFVFTDYDRFNFTLVAGPKDSADYLVVVKRTSNRKAPPYVLQGEEGRKPPPPSKLSTKRVGKSVSNAGRSLTVVSVQWPESRSSLIINLEISLTEEIALLKGSDLEVSQGGRKLLIESFHLANETRSTHATLVLRQNQLDLGSPTVVRLKHPILKAPLQVTIPALIKRK